VEIWIFNHYAIGPGTTGGTRHYDLAKHLVKKGNKVKIFASSFNHQTRTEEHLFNKELYKISHYDGVEFIWIKTHPYQGNNHHRVLNMLTYYANAKKIAKTMDGTPDIVIGSLVHPLAAFLGYKVSKKKKTLFYFEERDLWPQTLIDLGKLSKKNPAIKIMYRMEKFLYTKSDRIIVLFENAKSYVSSTGVNNEKVMCIPNGIDMDRLSDIDENLPDNMKRYFESNKESINIVYAGTHGMANNLEIILEAAKELQDENVNFLFVGDGPNKSHLINIRDREELKNVSFFDPVKKELIPKILQSSDIGLLPLKNSPVFKWGISPNKLFDYMSNKLPVILLCDIEDSPVQRAESGYTIKTNFKENLVSILKNIDKKSLNLMGEKGYIYVKENHNWEMLSDKLIKAIENDLEHI